MDIVSLSACYCPRVNQLLRPLRLGPFRTIFLSRVVSELGTWLAYIGLTVAVFDRTHSASWVGALLLLDMLPAVLLGFALAPLLDRLNRKQILVAAEATSGVLFAVLVFLHGLAPLLVVAGLSGVASSLFLPSLSAALPQVVSDQDLPQANALVRGVSSLAILVGPPIAGVLVGFAGVATVFAVNSISYLISALLLSRISRASLQSQSTEHSQTESEDSGSLFTGHWQRARQGFALFRPPRLKAVLVGWSLVCFALSAINICEVLIAKRVFAVGDSGFGLLAAGSGAGLLVGSLLLSWLATRRSSFFLYSVGLLWAGVFVMAAAVSPWFPMAWVFFAIGAAGNALALTSMQVVLQRGLPEESSGQGFGVFSSCATAFSVLGFVAAGPIADHYGARAVWFTAGGFLVVGSLASLAIARGADSSDSGAVKSLDSEPSF